MAKKSTAHVRPVDEAPVIIRLLEKNTAAGCRQSDVFDDWIEIVEAFLERLPEHVKSIVATGDAAEDTPETAKVWKRLRDRYKHPSYFENFSAATNLLMDGSTWADGTPDWKDTIGNIYMAFGYPSSGTGQFFTPWHLAKAMAEMTSDHGALVHEHIQEAIRQSPLAQAMLMSGIPLEGDAAQRWLVTRIVPACIEHFKPVTISDPACGSGVMMLAAASTYPAWMTRMGLVQFYGQDIDHTCVRMARINMMLYGLNGYGLRLEEAILSAPAAKVGEAINLAPPPLPAYAVQQMNFFGAA